MREDDKKVKAKIAELNNLYKPAKWDSVEGFHTSYSIIIEKDGTQTIDPGRGLTFKYFINIETQELKSFYHKGFIED